MKQRAPDAKPRKAGEIAVQVVMLLVLLAAALVVMRSLGPGGSPGMEEGERKGTTPRPSPKEDGSHQLGVTVLDAAGKGRGGAFVEVVLESADGAVPKILRGECLTLDGTIRFTWPKTDKASRVSRVRASHGHVSMEGVPTGDEVTLRLPATFPVSGRVMAAEDGRPLEGMDVKLGERVARTDDRGRFSFGQIPGDAVLPDIEVTGAGRRPLRRALPAEGGLDDLHLSVEGE